MPGIAREDRQPIRGRSLLGHLLCDEFQTLYQTHREIDICEIGFWLLVS